MSNDKFLGMNFENFFVRIGRKFMSIRKPCKKPKPKPKPTQKLALLFGLNYLGTQSELGGCINDVDNMKKILENQYKYDKVYYLTDNSVEKPTKSNMLKYLNKVVEESKDYSQIYIHYSGHGSYITDKNNDELDGRDECLIPLDYGKSGFITDDTLKPILSKVQCKLVCVIDACHSATILDLKYRIDCTSVQLEQNEKDDEAYLYKNWSYDFKEQHNPKYEDKKNNIFMISGCRDVQTSADAWINSKYQGALSYHLMKALELNNFDIKIKYLLKDIHCMLKLGHYEQKPVLSGSKAIDLEAKFLL